MRQVPRRLFQSLQAKYEHVFVSNHSLSFEVQRSLSMFIDLLTEDCQLPQISIVPYNMAYSRPRFTIDKG